MAPGLLAIIIVVLLAGGATAAMLPGLKTPSGDIKSIISFPKPELDAIYQKYALQYGLDWKLIKAVAQVESSENPKAVNPNDPSYGLMQILCQDNGYGGCKNKFNIQGWPPYSKNELLDPDYNVKIGSQILAWNIETYGREKGIAVYNNWSAREDPVNGPFRNQEYVDKVNDKYSKIA